MTTRTGRDPLRRSVDWIYGGVWGVLTQWFRVPAEPPTLPATGGAAPVSMRPADGFLSYLRTLFALGWLVPLVGLTIGAAIMTATLPPAAALIAPPIAGVVAILIGAGWIAIHLQFDTQWYVFSDRSVRIRRGVWIIRENTITFENVQDITVLQGPLQRYFGISDIVVETAGGSVSSDGKGHTSVNTNAGRLEGVADAAGLKEIIARRVRASRSAGLGDEHREERRDDAHVAVLNEILAELRATHFAP